MVNKTICIENNVELLVPAGSAKSLAAAVSGGADAVYLAGKRYSARRYANNFTDSQLKSALEYLHSNGVKGYVAVNTLIKDSEMADVLSFVSFLEDVGADAMIIQDRGLLEELQGFNIPLHASTQMGLQSEEDLLWAADKRISRVILPRELRLEEIESLGGMAPVELEVFVHGALCYSVSGQCLFSSMLGGRSGNRGACAQPCRKRYTLTEEEGYLLSTADLECLDVLPRLRDAGVSALKVEGRIRSPLYVRLVTEVYSQAIRSIEGKEPWPDDRKIEMMRTVFNRGYSKGHLIGGPVRQTTYADNRGLPLGTWKFSNSVLVTKDECLRSGDGVSLYQKGEKVGGFRIHDPQNVISPFPLKDGNYDAYKNYDVNFEDISASIPDLFLKENNARRSPVKLEKRPRKRHKRKGELSVYLSSIKSLQSVVEMSDRVYFEYNRHIDEAKSICEDAGVEIVTIMPRFTPLIPEMEEGALMVHGPGQALKYTHRRLYGSYHMNFFNSSFPNELWQQTISPELNIDEIKKIVTLYPGRLEVMVFGRLELMLSMDPTLPEGTLIDEKGYRFPVNRDRYGVVHILNSADLSLLERLEDLDRMGIDSHGIDLRRRPADMCHTVMEIFRSRDLSRRRELRKLCGDLTYGHFYRGV